MWLRRVCPNIRPEVQAFYVELEKFYEDTFYKVIVDFNDKIGPRRTLHRNPRMDLGFLRLQFHNEIDHFIFNRKYCLTDVSVVPKFYAGSDHRLLRARLNDLLPLLTQLPDTILPELLRPGVDPLLDMVLKNDVYLLEYGIDNPPTSCLQDGGWQDIEPFCDKAIQYFTRFATKGQPTKNSCEPTNPTWPAMGSTKRDYYVILKDSWFKPANSNQAFHHPVAGELIPVCSGVGLFLAVNSNGEFS
ncbi:unnamed protein product [Heligmosomoides polygyrus]|uniref:FCP1 homology domain-containing protein n=1 Tax=Heligmosomoides polygyrus TaxID=6339 RepID=A0A3P8CMQ2_HELPZ|nr:unnamed protein product [Heligmosomoides polygyrus]